MTENTPIVFDKTKHIKLSTSCVQTYEQCPRRWYYRYVKKLFPKVEESKWTAFGNFIHDVAENYKDGCSLKEFKELVAERLKFHEIDESYRAKIVPAIKNLYIYCNQKFKPGDVIDRERKIEFHYKDKFFITGKIDVIHARVNDVSIIDWKTSKAEKDHSFQLAMYMFMLEVAGLISVPKINCEIVYLCAAEKDELLYVSKYAIEKDDVQSALARIENVINAYNRFGTEIEDKWKKKTGKLCEYCDYYKANICDGKSC